MGEWPYICYLVNRQERWADNLEDAGVYCPVSPTNLRSCMSFAECPECGTEILEADDCPSCGGSGEGLMCAVPLISTECEDCNGTGKSQNYHCPHCDWSHEE